VARPSPVSRKRKRGGLDCLAWPLGGLEVNIWGQLQNDPTLIMN
jgi:hypothetical protein